MMEQGLGNNETRRKYIGIKEGKIVQRKQNEILEYEHVCGMITNLSIKHDGKFGPELHIQMEANGEIYVLQMRVGSGYGMAFMRICNNIDFSYPVKIRPTFKEEDGRKNTGMFVMQDETAVRWFHTKSDPKGMPEGVPCKIKNASGQLVDSMDYSSRIAFLIAQMEGNVCPRVKQAANAHTVQSTNPISADQHSENTEPDDLPF